MFYGKAVWDPWLIVAQIVAIQCLYYLTLGAFLTVFVGSRVSRFSLVYFFDYATVTASTATGWCVIVSILLSAVACAVYLVYSIERSKKCLDFSATVYIIHLFICIAYGDWPSSITWWAVHGTGLAVMALLGRQENIFSGSSLHYGEVLDENIIRYRYYLFFSEGTIIEAAIMDLDPYGRQYDT